MKTTSHSDGSPADIINNWISKAKAKNMTAHLKMFWIIRDVVEFYIEAKGPLVESAMEFLKNCAVSMERNTLIEAVGQIMYYAEAYSKQKQILGIQTTQGSLFQ